MIVRRCTIEDIEDVYKIEQESFSDPMKRETMVRDMERDSYYCYGLFDGVLKAFISFEKVFDEGQIISVATDAEHRREGCAKKLFAQVTELAKTAQIQLFTLEVRSDNTPAVALYKSLGFKEVGRRKNYYKSPLSDAILMDLQLEE